ncbi:MAG: RnfH family protein, partial [Vibrio sp.]
MSDVAENQNQILHVEVVYPLPHEQKVFTLAVRPNMSVEAIIQESGVLEQYPEIDLSKNKVGIFSRNVKLDSLVQDKDRIEIYRPLLADPKEIRRKRAEQAKKQQAKK